MTRTTVDAKGRTLISDAPAYRVVTSITSPDGETYSDHARDFATFGAALKDYEVQTCSLRVVGHALVRMSDGATLERKGWLYGHDSGDFAFRSAKPRYKAL